MKEAPKTQAALLHLREVLCLFFAVGASFSEAASAALRDQVAVKIHPALERSAKAAGIKSAAREGYHAPKLFSEDLY
jgi:hypothetical protein